jgi:hypothetical protein
MRAFVLDADAWAECLAAIAPAGQRLVASVTLLGREAAARAEPGVERTLHAIGYDSARDVLEVGLGGASHGPALRHFICGPRLIALSACGDVRSILVADATGARTSISLRRIAPAASAAEQPGRVAVR